MEIKKIRLNNVGRFADLEVAFAPTEKHASKVTVFVGNNGAGKTTILKSIATAMSWFVESLRTDAGRGDSIEEDLIRNGTITAKIAIEIRSLATSTNDHEAFYTWSLAKSLRGRKVLARSDLGPARKLADIYSDALTLLGANTSLPLIAYYPVERSVLSIPLDVPKGPKIDPVDGYDKSLNSGVNFSRFFAWFRDREDIENERGISSSFMTELSKKLAKDAPLWKEIEAVKALSRDVQLSYGDFWCMGGIEVVAYPAD
ncbi:MAG: DNA replication and repair protein RecF [Pseudomonas sp.]|nr:MAG: DNA replication and repair protein RecF [Pseudomonas sp.]